MVDVEEVLVKLNERLLYFFYMWYDNIKLNYHQPQFVMMLL
jgi:hypothetical protein